MADFGGVDVAGMISNAAKILSGQLSETSADLDTAQKGFKAATGPQGEAIRGKAAAETDQLVNDEVYKERIRQMNAEAAAAFGTNPGANSFVLAGLGEELRGDIQKLAGMRKDIQERKNLGILDDPLQFIFNQVLTPFKEEAAEYQEASIEQNLRTAQGLIARTHESFAINAAIADTESETRINALKKTQLAKVNLEVLQSDERIARSGVEFINVRNAASRAQFEAVSSAVNIQVKLEELKLSERAADRADVHLDIDKARLALAQTAEVRAQEDERRKDVHLNLAVEASGRDAERLQLAYRNATNDDERLKLHGEMQTATLKHQALQEEMAERDESRKEQYLGLAIRGDIRAADQAVLSHESQQLHNSLTKLQIDAAGGSLEAKATLTAALQRAAAVTGSEAPTLDQFKLMDARQKASWQRLMSDPNVMGEGRLGYNVGMVMEEVTENNWPLTGNMRAVYNNLDRIRAETIAKYTSGTNPVTWQQLGKDGRANAINQDIKTQLNREIKNIPDSGSIFSPPPVAAVLRIPAVADTSIAKDLAPQGINPNNPLRAQDVLSSAIMKMSKGEATPQQMASEISTIYKAIIADNNVQRQYSRFAIGGMSELSTGFKTSVKLGNYYQGAPTFASSSKVVDLSNEAQMTSVLTREAARMNIQKQLNNAGTGGQP